MSNLLALYQGTAYPRLTALNAGKNELKSSYNFSNGTTFSVRAQGNPATDEERQNNAVNFFDNSGSAFVVSYANGFKINKSAATLSTTGYRKATAADTSDYVGDPTDAGKTEAKSGLTHYTKLVLNSAIYGSQKYNPVVANKTYLDTINAVGENLTYGTIPAIPSAPTRTVATTPASTTPAAG